MTQALPSSLSAPQAPAAAQPEERGWRGSFDLWLDAAYEALIDGGLEAVKVLPLAQRLNLSRTSFYWHFTSREALLSALVDRWRHRNSDELIAHCDRPASSLTEAILNVFDCWVDPALFDSRLEFAIRNWATADAALARQLQDQDQLRIAALAAMFRRFGVTAQEADTRAHTVYLTQIGYIAMKTEESFDQRLARIPHYAMVFTGQSPSPEEIASFAARNRQRRGG